MDISEGVRILGELVVARERGALLAAIRKLIQLMNGIDPEKLTEWVKKIIELIDSIWPTAAIRAESIAQPDISDEALKDVVIESLGSEGIQPASINIATWIVVIRLTLELVAKLRAIFG